jgi:hypothetical protein
MRKMHLRLADHSERLQSNGSGERSLVKSILLLLAILGICSTSLAQTPSYIPIGPSSGQRPVRGTLSKSDMEKRGEALGLSPDTLNRISATAAEVNTTATASTASPPTSVTGNLQYSQTMMSISAAIKAQIPFLNANGSGTQMVLVRDFMKSQPCVAADGKTRLLYGQTIRTIITIADYDAKIGTSLPVLAADSTINKKNHQINIVILGFDNPKFNDVIGSLSSREFNVETYVQFLELQSQLIKLIGDSGTTQSIQRLGVLPDVDPSTLAGSAAIAYTLQQISDGKSCNKAKSDFPSKTDPSASAIPDTYQMLTGTCDDTSPSTVQRAQAKQYLLGIKVKY